MASQYSFPQNLTFNVWPKIDYKYMMILDHEQHASFTSAGEEINISSIVSVSVTDIPKWRNKSRGGRKMNI